MTLLKLARQQKQHFPLASRKSRIKQAAALAAAKLHLRENGLEAAVVGSKFEYKMTTASVLP